jgi:hypothetical protein
LANDWVTMFNHVRPHEALGLKTPGEIYRASPRRPGRIVVGGYYERGYRVWFFDVLLGTFVPGTHETLQPALVEER